MFTIEEFVIICGATALALLCIYAIGYVLLLAIMARIDARRDAQELRLRQDIGNDLHPFNHHGRG